MYKLDQQLDKVNDISRNIRGKLFFPIVKMLDKIGIGPNFLSFLKIFFAAIYVIIIKINFELAVYSFLFGSFIDIFDGTLARYSGKASDRGKFIDMYSDHILYILFVFGLMIIKIGDPILLAYNTMILATFYLIIIVNKNETLPSDWIIKPIARATYYKLAFGIAVIFHIIFNMSVFWFNKIILIINIIITLHFLYHFIKFLIKKDIYKKI